MKLFKLEESPFAYLKKSPEVYVAGGNGPYNDTMAALANIDLSPAKGKRVLLKPNAGRLAKAGQGITTEPQVVAATIDAFNNAGADVTVGESPITGIDTMKAFEVTGIATVAQERGCPLVDMDARPYVLVELPDGIAIKSIKMCPEMLEYDIIVSIPVMKMHMHTGVTLAVKNMKGCLWRRSKVKLHMLPPNDSYPDEKPINIAIADMSYALRPHLSIIDGSIGLQGLGPSAGTPKKLGVTVVGVDPFATDAVACRLMGTKAEDIPHIYLAAARDYGVIDMNKIHVFPDNWSDFANAFEPPPQNISIQYPGIKIHDKNSCSACQSTIMLFLKEYGKHLSELMNTEDVNLAIGTGHDDLPCGTLCLGNCVAKHKDKGIFVKGCPPVMSEMLIAITGKPTL